MKKVYAGVGSRETPEDILAEMRRLGETLASTHILHSGAAPGADEAFEAGATAVGGECRIYLPWKGFNYHSSPLFGVTAAALEMAEREHPAWDRLSPAARKLHARNCNQILGDSLDEPVEFVLCWTPDGCESKKTRGRNTGGTASAIVLGEKYGRPVFNLKNEDSRARLTEYLAQYGHDVSWLGGKRVLTQGGLF